ncbi:MAG: phosphoribosylformylglycinamidine synthase subunit PurS, partial [Phycisphaerales bacterium]|nr:phosphoribosylformylglycinamidine synthase subunit PurS [Phycisphaerales bacterium]
MDAPAVTVSRIEIHPKHRADDPRARALLAGAAQTGSALTDAVSTRVYLLSGDLDNAALALVAEGLLADPVTQHVVIGATPTPAGFETIEVHPLPGVMDPVAQSAARAIEEMIGIPTDVKTGWRYDMAGVTQDQARRLAAKLLANPVIERIHVGTYLPDRFPTGEPREPRITHIPIRELDDAALARLSREAHLFLSVPEMRAIAEHYREKGREPTDVELETLAQTWSEHCVHKTLKSTIRYEGDLAGDVIDWTNRPGHELQANGTVLIHNLLKSTVAAATHELIADGLDWTLSVFVDNAGIIRFDDQHAVCVKVETHNHPSAIEPYGGAATGIGGCIRDVIGTGLAAKPIASTDVFCVGPPDTTDVPAGCLHPKRILTQITAGIRDYGNRMGIPTVNGAVYFDSAYVGNPLVYCGSIGVMPIDRVEGDANPGDHIIVLGGSTGRDGIHGATFSSAELTDTHADEFSHAVQIGNAIEEKRFLDAILQARDALDGPIYSAITDCGAGGFSSAVGEMGEMLGATVHLERAPLKYEGLSYTEIWISEAQERMTLAVPLDKIDALQRICDAESVDLCDLGTFGTPNRELVLNCEGIEVGRLSMEFLHHGLPDTHRSAKWLAIPTTPTFAPKSSPDPTDITDMLHRLLAHPNIASKHWIIRQYDHEVQGGSVVKPLCGPDGTGPSDAAVVRPVLTSSQGLAIASGLATGFGHPDVAGDPYLMTLAAIDECVRNLVCVGADPTRIAILDNFCWPSCDDPEQLASLVRAAEGCYDAVKAYRTPFISGKDSLNNQFTTDRGETIRIPPTLLITGVGIVPNVRRCVTVDAKPEGSVLLIVGSTGDCLRGSHVAAVDPSLGESSRIPMTDLAQGPRAAAAVAELIQRGLVLAAHDCSDGGLLVAAAEMAFAGNTQGQPIGLELDLDGLPGPADRLVARAFAESTSRYLLQIRLGDIEHIKAALADLPHAVIGTFSATGRLTLPAADVDEDLADLQR